MSGASRFHCLRHQHQLRFRCLRHQLLQNNDILLDGLTKRPPARPNNLYVVFHVRYYMKQQPDDDDEYVMINFAEVASFGFLDLFQEEFELSVYLGMKLDSLDVPKRYQKESLCPFIAKFAKQMQNDPCNANQAWLGMVVAIDILDEAAAISSRFPSIQALEKVIVGGDHDINECAICLEKPSLGDEFAHLPCSHMYHRICIARLLQKAKSCPLCPLCRQPFTVLTHSALHVLGGEAWDNSNTQRNVRLVYPKEDGSIHKSATRIVVELLSLCLLLHSFP